MVLYDVPEHIFFWEKTISIKCDKILIGCSHHTLITYVGRTSRRSCQLRSLVVCKNCPLTKRVREMWFSKARGTLRIRQAEGLHWISAALFARSIIDTDLTPPLYFLPSGQFCHTIITCYCSHLLSILLCKVLFAYGKTQHIFDVNSGHLHK